MTTWTSSATFYMKVWILKFLSHAALPQSMSWQSVVRLFKVLENVMILVNKKHPMLTIHVKRQWPTRLNHPKVLCRALRIWWMTRCLGKVQSLKPPWSLLLIEWTRHSPRQMWNHPDLKLPDLQSLSFRHLCCYHRLNLSSTPLMKFLLRADLPLGLKTFFHPHFPFPISLRLLALLHQGISQLNLHNLRHQRFPLV